MSLEVVDGAKSRSICNAPILFFKLLSESALEKILLGVWQDPMVRAAVFPETATSTLDLANLSELQYIAAVYVQ